MTTEVLNIKSLHDYEILENQIQMISQMQSQLEKGTNLADIVWEMEASGSISKKQIPAFVYTLLIEKYNYSCLSFNLSATLSDWSKIHQTVKTWNRFDTVLAYYHPQLDVSLINPANEEHWDRIESLAAYEMMVIFTRAKKESLKEKEKKLLQDFKAICSGKQIDIDSDYITAPGEDANERPVTKPDTESKTAKAESEAKPVEAPAAKTEGDKKKRITPKYGVQVSNELFHNGNVEAWRNIIESYEKTYKGSMVLLFHNGQRIKHISSLFKWGKVKTGDSIFFSIVGDEIKDVAKLKKYLYQGASESFKSFVKKDVNVVLKLF
ncbi:MAG: hypothetical protein MJE63_16760 [Proteobacteria bacterium]|nr:hypothetical protein [Pseudomonadota bacterium]